MITMNVEVQHIYSLEDHLSAKKISKLGLRNSMITIALEAVEKALGMKIDRPFTPLPSRGWAEMSDNLYTVKDEGSESPTICILDESGTALTATAEVFVLHLMFGADSEVPPMILDIRNT